jgi:hypothetical protein
MLLQAFAVIAGLAGLLFMSQATAGVGLIGFGCLLMILARIQQAERHHKAAAAALEGRLSPYELQRTVPHA